MAASNGKGASAAETSFNWGGGAVDLSWLVGISAIVLLVIVAAKALKD